MCFSTFLQDMFGKVDSKPQHQRRDYVARLYDFYSTHRDIFMRRKIDTRQPEIQEVYKKENLQEQPGNALLATRLAEEPRAVYVGKTTRVGAMGSSSSMR